MKTQLIETRLELDRTRFEHIVNGKGTVVTCLAGDLWITRDHSPHDVWLTAGEAYSVPDGKHVLVNAFGRSEAVIRRPAARAGLLPTGKLASMIAAGRAFLRRRPGHPVGSAHAC